MAGRFISFEGIDGAGKTTHIAALADHLRAAGTAVVATREPGGTPLAEGLRGLLLGQPMDALTESLLVFAARRDHLRRVIEPALQRGDTVLCDRFTDATFAYQGSGHGVDIEQLQALESWVHGGLQPDLTLWFDVAVTEAAARRSRRHLAADGAGNAARADRPAAAQVEQLEQPAQRPDAADRPPDAAAASGQGARASAAPAAANGAATVASAAGAGAGAASAAAGAGTGAGATSPSALQAAATTADRFEQQDARFFERVRAGYAARLAESPQRIVRIDAAVSRELVWQQVAAALAQHGLPGPLTGRPAAASS